ncbi:MAG: hypothetical protein CMF41_00650 [Legionellales bacterium]|nr:hypothetical protein [Legionellales bacterium]
MLKKPIAIFIVPTNYSSLKEKGVLNILKDREEYGKFKKIIVIHPFTKKTQKILYSKIQEIHEFKYSFSYNFLRFLLLPVHIIKILFFVNKLCKNMKIDFIRAQDPYVSGMLGLMIAKLLKCKFCISIHADYDKRHLLDPRFGAPKICGSRFLAKQIERLNLGSSDLLLPIRESLKQKLIKNGYLKRKIEVLPHIVNLNHYKLKPNKLFFKKNKISPKSKIISFSGRFSKENYIYDYIKIAKNFIDNNKIKFVMAGDGVEMASIKKIIENDKKLKKRILLLGFVDSQEVRNLRQLSYINLSLMGGFSLIECCASGRPTISYEVEWHSELIENERTGYLVKENDHQEVCRIIKKLITMPKKALILGEKAKKITFQKHNYSQNKNKRIQIYQKLLK